MNLDIFYRNWRERLWGRDKAGYRKAMGKRDRTRRKAQRRQATDSRRRNRR